MVAGPANAAFFVTYDFLLALFNVGKRHSDQLIPLGCSLHLPVSTHTPSVLALSPTCPHTPPCRFSP
jgi:hypothetical protein